MFGDGNQERHDGAMCIKADFEGMLIISITVPNNKICPIITDLKIKRHSHDIIVSL